VRWRDLLFSDRWPADILSDSIGDAVGKIDSESLARHAGDERHMNIAIVVAAGSCGRQLVAQLLDRRVWVGIRFPQSEKMSC
jgi:hypothetical protein